jgi:hypothetical protein
MYFKYIIISKELSKYSDFIIFINVRQKKPSCSWNHWNFHTTNQIRTRAIVVVILWWLDLQLPMHSVPITTKVVSVNPTQTGCT